MEKWAHRKSKTVMTLMDAQGKPMPGRRVQIDLDRHEFLFGCGIFWVTELADPAVPPERKAYLEKLWESWAELFNYGTLAFYQSGYEAREGMTRQAATLRGAAFLKAHGVTAKGHPLCWHETPAKWVDAKSNDEVLEIYLNRIRRELGAFKDTVSLWDVINEVVIMPVYRRDNPVSRLGNHMGPVQLVKVLFDEARQADPNATLLLNDFNTSDKYRQLIEECLAAGVPMDVIGIQSHQHQGFWGLDKLHEVLERFEGFGLPMHFTENTFVSGDLIPPHIRDLNDWKVAEWPTTPEGEERQARDLLAMIDTLFDHPQVEAFTNWDFADGAWLGAPSGLVRRDGSRKPAWEALRQRIRGDWATHLTLTTDENGQAAVEGFRGEYTLKVDGQEAKFTLKKDQPEVTVQL